MKFSGPAVRTLKGCSARDESNRAWDVRLEAAARKRLSTCACRPVSRVAIPAQERSEAACRELEINYKLGAGWTCWWLGRGAGCPAGVQLLHPATKHFHPAP